MRALAAGLLALACCMPAAAQQRSEEPSAAQRCLHHEAGPQAQPEYPREIYHDNRGGRVQVELRFEGPQARPSSRVLLHEGDDSILESVRQHLRGLRVPCMRAGGEPVVLRQEYAFVQDQRQVQWSRALDTNAPDSDHFWACVVHPDRSGRPEYPELSRLAGEQGRVVLRLNFEQADAPPRVEVFSRDSARRLARYTVKWVEDYRMPCLGQRPVSILMTFVYTIEGQAYGFRDLNLLQVLKLSRGIREQKLALDTRTMGCPFELRFKYMRPLQLNLVGEPGDPVPARRPLLEWLEQAELELPARSLDAIWGDHVKLAVPCLNIDLKPKEKT